MELLFVCRRIAGGLLTVALLPVAAQAQDLTGMTLSAGVLGARDSAPFGDIFRPVFTLALQRAIADHVALEGELTRWTYLRHLEFGPHPITGPQGTIGTVTGSATSSSHEYWSYGVNALVKSGGQVRFFGGAGVGLSHDRHDFRQQSYGCSPSLDARSCDRFETHYDRGPVIVLRALGGIEIPIARHVGLVWTLRGERTAWEDRATWVSTSAGIRVSFD